MMKLPILGFVTGIGVLEKNWVRTHFTEPIKVQLTHKRREVVVLKVFGDEFKLKFLGVLHNKRQSIVRPFEKIKWRRNNS